MRNNSFVCFSSRRAKPGQSGTRVTAISPAPLLIEYKRGLNARIAAAFPVSGGLGHVGSPERAEAVTVMHRDDGFDIAGEIERSHGALRVANET
jgi:hypothetical protein